MSRLDDLYRLHRLLDGRRTAISRQTLLDELAISRSKLTRVIADLRDRLDALRLPMSVNEWVERALDRPEIRLIGLEHARTVIDSCRLPGDFHPDPADRLLVATARRENAVFVTQDRKILDYGAGGHGEGDGGVMGRGKNRA